MLPFFMSLDQETIKNAKFTKEHFESLRDNGQDVYKGKIITNSMVPIINVGDHIIVAKQKDGFEPFDIIVFWQNEKLICHVVLGISKHMNQDFFQYQTVPYNFVGYDPSFNSNQVLGKVLNFKLSFWNKLKLFYRYKIKK